jgi:hypothetical protein
MHYSLLAIRKSSSLQVVEDMVSDTFELERPDRRKHRPTHFISLCAMPAKASVARIKPYGEASRRVVEV